MHKEKAKREILKLVKFYNQNTRQVQRYSETDTRVKFIDKIFEALGWDVNGRKIPDEVLREDSVKGKESMKKVDYTFRINGVTKFVVEAKAIKEDLEKEVYKRQAIDYAYNKACSWAVLTDFEGVKIYFVDRESDTAFFDINLIDLDKFEQSFERLWFLSKESVLNDCLENEAKIRGTRKEKISINQQLYEDLKKWRKILSDDITKRYKDKYEGHDIDETVQRIIDRLIFIRKTEDAEIEDRKLDQLTRRFNKRTYEELKEIFVKYNENYNSKLFGEETGKKHLCDKINISSDVIEKVIHGMYRPEGSKIEYNFAAIDADILGSIYEQYLAFILKKTPKRAQLKGGRTHRKEQGIYYTPTYIVDYIVRNTLGELLKDKNVDASKLRVLDPACGSGSFLIKSYDYFSNYYDKQLGKEKQTTLERAREGLFTRKSKIMKNNIYGVDLDAKAVEIAQLNLLLKLAEKRHRLPTLKDNIRCGNSLIDNPEIVGDKAFKWEEKFEDIIQYDEAGNLKQDYGFDVVIGNPPYFNIETMTSKEKEALRKYECYSGKSDILYYFYNKAISILKPDGLLGFITSRYFIEATHAKNLRKYILENCDILKIIDLSNLPVFKDVGIHTVIIILKKKGDKARNNNKLFYKDVSSVKQLEDLKGASIQQNRLDENAWVLGSTADLEIFKRVDSCKTVTLGEISVIEQGQKSGLNSAFTVTEKDVKEKKLEKEFIRKLVKNSYIKPYFIEDRELYLIYASSEMSPNNAPNIILYLEIFKKQLNARAEACDGLYPWYRLQRPRSKKLFDAKEKIVVPYRAEKNRFGYDDRQRYNDGGDIRIIVIKNSKYLTKYILALLNSKLMNFYYSFVGRKKGRMFEYFVEPLQKIPIVAIDIKRQESITVLVDKMLSLNERLNKLGDKKTDESASIEEEIENTDKKIDDIVYDIYGITKKEKKIIENSLN